MRDTGSETVESFEPVEVLAGTSQAARRVLLLCDHASNAVPPWLDLGIGAEDMARHIAWDVGAEGVTRAMASALGAGAVLTRFSRLVIDPNRGEDDPTLVMKLYDGTIIPGNRDADAVEIERRLERCHRPYHRAVASAIEAIEGEGALPVLVSIHSFTPQLRGRSLRPWHLALLWDQDDRLLRPLVEALMAEPEVGGEPLCIGDNEPYTGALAGDCMNQHGTRRGLPHILIEVRNDLIAVPEGQAAWGGRLARAVQVAVGQMVV